MILTVHLTINLSGYLKLQLGYQHLVTPQLLCYYCRFSDMRIWICGYAAGDEELRKEEVGADFACRAQREMGIS